MDYKIRPVSKVCAESGNVLIPGDMCWSVLIEIDGKLVRRDISETAWKGPPENSIGHWQCEVPANPDEGQRKLDPNSLFDYFIQLCESPNRIEQDYQYVLALLLLRKRRLILEDSITIDDQPGMRLIGSGGEGPFDVMERELSEEQIAQLQSQLFDETSETPEAAA